MNARKDEMKECQFENGNQITVTEFDLDDGSGENGTGVPRIHYVHDGEECQEVIHISFKDIMTLFRNEGIDPDDKHDGRYHFVKTPVTLNNFGFIKECLDIEWEGEDIMLSRCGIKE